MKIATIRHGASTSAAVLDREAFTPIDFADAGAWLRAGSPEPWSHVDGDPIDRSVVMFAPLVTQPGKIICVGLNYRDHILEMGRAIPEVPTLFAKFAESLIGAGDRLVLPRGSEKVDWEAELAIVIGSRVRHADTAGAAAAIAGFTVANDVSARDYQRRTTEWLQGKMFDHTNPLGPVLTTTDEIGVEPAFDIGCSVNGVRKQHGNTGQLVFGPLALVRYISSITTLMPGDVILTGTPGGVGDGREPQEYLHAGDVLMTWISMLGSSENTCVPDAGPPVKKEE